MRSHFVPFHEPAGLARVSRGRQDADLEPPDRPCGLRRDGTVRTTAPVYERIDAPTTQEQKAILERLSPAQASAHELAGDPVEAMLTAPPGNGAPLGGIKVVTKRGWFAARPSGTENIYKLCADSFAGEDHLRRRRN